MDASGSPVIHASQTGHYQGRNMASMGSPCVPMSLSTASKLHPSSPVAVLRDRFPPGPVRPATCSSRRLAAPHSPNSLPLYFTLGWPAAAPPKRQLLAKAAPLPESVLRDNLQFKIPERESPAHYEAALLAGSALPGWPKYPTSLAIVLPPTWYKRRYAKMFFTSVRSSPSIVVREQRGINNSKWL